MADQVPVFLPEFDDLTESQAEQISRFADAHLSPEAIKGTSYAWLLETSGTADEFTHATIVPSDADKGGKKKDSSSPSASPSGGGEKQFPMCRRRTIAYKLLVARKWDDAAAAEMLRTSVAWREGHRFHSRPFFPSPIVINGYDDVTLQRFFGMPVRPQNEDVDRIVRRLRPHYWCNFHKHDKSGHPVVIELIGQVDAKKGLKALREVVRPGQPLSQPVADMHSFQNELANYLIRFQDAQQRARWVDDQLRQQQQIMGSNGHGGKEEEKEKKDEDDEGNASDDSDAAAAKVPPIPSTGPVRRVTSLTAILDATGLSMSLLSSDAMEIVKTMLTLDQANYPELLHRCFIVNCPSLLMFAYNIVKGYIDPRVNSKITFCSVADTPAILRKVIDEDKLPVFLGGTCECDGGCVCKTARRFAECEGGAAGGVVGVEDEADSGFVRTEEADIPSRGQKVETIELTKGERVAWEWESVGNKTIEFSVAFYPTASAKDYTETVRQRRETMAAAIAATSSSASPSASSSAPTGLEAAAAEIALLERWETVTEGSSSSSAASSSSPSSSPNPSHFVDVHSPARAATHTGEFGAVGSGGRLVVTWSNAFSVFTGKTLRYRLVKSICD